MPYTKVHAGDVRTPALWPGKMTAQKLIHIGLLLCLTSIHLYGNFRDALIRVRFHHESEGVLYEGRFFPDTKIGHTAEFGGTVIDSSGHTLCYVGSYWPKLVQGKPRIEVHAKSGKRYDAQLIGVDERSGLAVLKTVPQPLQHLTLDARSSRRGWRFVCLSEGRWKEFVPSALTSAPGASQRLGEQRLIVQSPPRGLANWEASWVLDADGRLAGIVTRSHAYPFSRRLQECWVLPARELQDSLFRIRDERSNIKAGWLGVILNRAREDIRIRGVVGGSPADGAGFLAGDVIARWMERPSISSLTW